MSADNYIYVRKREDGKFGASMRCASSYYRDQGDVPREYGSYTGTSKGWYLGSEHGLGPFPTIEAATEANPVREDWLEDAPEDHIVADTAEEAVMAAHKWRAEEDIVEYGVSVASEVLTGGEVQ